ncbi:hypothetical protein C7271_02090 [filamentous cyanobacterium CCP5]|nr:hypothetical protein C7271_02090 [filamentous cyanobacterium CCP5]
MEDRVMSQANRPLTRLWGKSLALMGVLAMVLALNFLLSRKPTPIQAIAQRDDSGNSPSAAKLASVRNWVYQLQGVNGGSLNLQPLAAYPADLAVIDYSRDGSEGGEFSQAEIANLQRSGKLVLSYMAIGTADTDRFYDQNSGDQDPFSHPEGRQLSTTENSDFPGTFYLHYWQPPWQATLFGDSPLPNWMQTNQHPENYLSRILNTGFDGVYLDDIDAYQQFNAKGDSTRSSAALDMVLLIQDISRWAKAYKADFLIFVQNGEAIFQDALDELDDNGDQHLDSTDLLIGRQNGNLFLDLNQNSRPDPGERLLNQLDNDQNGRLSQDEIEAAYFGSIDGLGVEDFFFKGNQAEDNPFISLIPAQDTRIDDFKFTAENYLHYAWWQIPIFSVEYLSPTNTTGLEQYQQVLSDQFKFMNPGITTGSKAPAFSEAQLQQLSLRLFASPSRELDRLTFPSSQTDIDSGDGSL